MPLRPIVSSVASPFYKLAKWLARKLSPVLGKISNSRVRNSVDFVKRCRNLTFNGKLISLDVESLFTKVPVSETIDFLRRKLPDCNLDIPIDLNRFIDLIELCVTDNVFEYDNDYYRQNYGMSMGSPLSPVLCNLFMEYFETELLPRISDIKWLRYVDDIFLVWPRNLNFDIFYNNLNNLHPTIKFKYEWENNDELPFLDVTVHKNYGNPLFSVFRKPTNSCSYIHSFSLHSKNVKKSVISSMFLRAYRLCSPQYLDNEIDTIKTTFLNLRYDMTFIEHAHKKARKTYYSIDNLRDFNVKDKKIVCVPYSNKLEHLQSNLQKTEYRIVFKYPNSSHRLLIRNKPLNENDACVYRIPCKDCNKVYWGETGRSLTTRLKEHKRDVKNSNVSNALFNHKVESDHRIDWDGAKPVYKCKSYIKRRLVESSLIAKFLCSNMSEGHFKLNKVLQNVIIDTLPSAVVT